MKQMEKEKKKKKEKATTTIEEEKSTGSDKGGEGLARSRKSQL
jgi:hypothetical protein